MNKLKKSFSEAWLKSHKTLKEAERERKGETEKETEPTVELL